MLKKRLIAVLTFNDGVLFRTKNFNPDYRYTSNFVDLWSIDELILLDVSKEKDTESFSKIVKTFSRKCFVPITVGGGIKLISEADLFFKNGADKVLIGSGSVDNPKLIKDISEKYGRQSIVHSIDCKKNPNNKNEYLVMKNSAKDTINLKPLERLNQILNYGVGEILVNSVDNDGGLLGFDLKLINLFKGKIKCPLLVLGGCGNWEHILEVFENIDVSGICTQNIYHFTEESIKSAKKYLNENSINIRK